MKFKPYNFQHSIIDHLVDNTHGALHVSPGLGKTPCALEAYHRLRQRGEFKGALIIAPLRVAYLVWADQIKEWGFPFTIANLRTPEGLQAWQDGSADFYSINFEMVSGRGSKKGFLDEHVTSKSIPVDTLLVDEVSLCKANSKRTKSIIKARKHFSRIHTLTGTPAPNSPLDLYFPLKIVDGGERLGKYVTHFKNRFFDSDFQGWKWTPKQGAVEKIQELISDICHVKLSEDHLKIPDSEVEDVNVKLSAAVMAQYRALERQLVIQIGDSVIDAQSAAVLIGKLQQITSGSVYNDEGEHVHLHTAKHKALAKILAKNKPVLVLTRYQSEMAAILEAFPQVQKFDESKMDDWKSGNIPVWVANPASLSHGIDGIQKSCSTIVWMSLTYSLEQYIQTNARILRTGQDTQAKIYRILGENTVDFVVANALEEKSGNQSALMQAVKMLQRANSEPQTPPSASKPSCESHDPGGSSHGLF